MSEEVGLRIQWDSIPVVINASCLLPGDVLLGYSSSTQQKIRNATKSGYSHAAICLSADVIEESSSTGVRKIGITELSEDYDHLVALRNPDAWNRSRIQILNAFVEDVIRKAAKFNTIGIGKFDNRKYNHEHTIYKRLEEFFEGKLQPDPPEKGAYFCSELVVAAFIKAGIIEKSASLLLSPEVMSPGDIAK